MVSGQINKLHQSGISVCSKAIFTHLEFVVFER